MNYSIIFTKFGEIKINLIMKKIIAIVVLFVAPMLFAQQKADTKKVDAVSLSDLTPATKQQTKKVEGNEVKKVDSKQKSSEAQKKQKIASKKRSKADVSTTKRTKKSTVKANQTESKRSTKSTSSSQANKADILIGTTEQPRTKKKSR